MDDRHIAAVDTRGVDRTEAGDNLLHQINRQNGGRVEVGAAGDGGLCAGAGVDLGRVHDVGARNKDITHDGIHRQARLIAEKFGGFQHYVVNRGQFQNVRQGNEVAVLADGGGDRGHVELVARRGYAFGKGRQSLGQRRELAEFNRFTAVLRNRPLLAELVMHKLCLRCVQKSLVVEGLHFRGQIVPGGIQQRGLNREQLNEVADIAAAPVQDARGQHGHKCENNKEFNHVFLLS